MIKFDFDLVTSIEHVPFFATCQIENIDIDEDDELVASGIIHNANDLAAFESFFKLYENDVDVCLELAFLEKFENLGYKTFSNDVDTFGISLTNSAQVLAFLEHVK